MIRLQFHRLDGIAACCLVIMLLLVGCADRDRAVAARTPNNSTSQPVDPAGYQSVKTFKRGNLEITVGLNRPQVRTVMAGGRQKFHGKFYAFRRVDEGIFARDVWELSYGPEVPGMGRVDLLRLTFKDGWLVKLEVKSIFCP